MKIKRRACGGVFPLMISAFVCAATALTAVHGAGLEVFPQAAERNFPHGYDVYSDAGKLLKTVPGPSSATVQAKTSGKSFATGEVYLSDWSYERMQKGEKANWIVAARASPEESNLVNMKRERPLVTSNSADSGAKVVTTVQTLTLDAGSADISRRLQMLAVGSENEQSIRLYDLKTTKLIRSIKHGEPVKALAFSQDGDQIMVAARYPKYPITLTTYSLDGKVLNKLETLGPRDEQSAPKSHQYLRITNNYSYYAGPIFSARTGSLQIFDYEYLGPFKFGNLSWINTPLAFKSPDPECGLEDETFLPPDALKDLGIAVSIKKSSYRATRLIPLPHGEVDTVLAQIGKTLELRNPDTKTEKFALKQSMIAMFHVSSSPEADVVAMASSVTDRVVFMSPSTLQRIDAFLGQDSQVWDMKWISSKELLVMTGVPHVADTEALLLSLKVTNDAVEVSRLGSYFVGANEGRIAGARIQWWQNASNEGVVTLRFAPTPQMTATISGIRFHNSVGVPTAKSQWMLAAASTDGRYKVFLNTSQEGAMLESENKQLLLSNEFQLRDDARVFEKFGLIAVLGNHRGSGWCDIYDVSGRKRRAFEVAAAVFDAYMQDEDHVIMVTPSRLICGNVATGKTDVLFDRGGSEFDASGGFQPQSNKFGATAIHGGHLAVLPDGTVAIIGSSKAAQGSLVARLACSALGSMHAVLPDSSYATSGTDTGIFHFVKGNQVFPFEQFDLRLNRPDIVLERLGAPAEAVAIAKQLREKRLKRMGVTEEMLKPDFHVPELEIVGDVPTTTDAGEINLAIKGSDSKYPLERLKVYVNNVPVNGRDGELLREESKSAGSLIGRITGALGGATTGPQALERTIPIKLAAGRNKIQVSVLNNAGAESLYANTEINCTAKRPKPTLYAVAMGVSEYSNPDWNLKYAAKDARDVLSRLKDKAGDQYGEVKELLLTDKDVTKENLAKVREFLKSATIDDTVLMFAAGHGLLDSKYDYYFGTTDIDFNNPSDKGIAFEEFDDILAELPCLKKSLLVDTCHAGELDQDEKALLASADSGGSAALPTGKGIAMRSIGTRGMNVKAIEGARGASEWYDRLQGLFVDLRRGSGSTILTSAAGAEYALESSEQQNGLFTYAVLEALDGKKEADKDKDGLVQMSELGEYVKKRVSELTNNKQTPNTRRVNLEGDFTLAKTK